MVEGCVMMGKRIPGGVVIREQQWEWFRTGREMVGDSTGSIMREREGPKEIGRSKAVPKLGQLR